MKCPDCGNEYKSVTQHLALSDCDYVKLNNRQKDIIIGTLMGDASILLADDCKNGQYKMKMKTKPYLMWLEKQFPESVIGIGTTFFAESAEESYENSDSLPYGGKVNKENYSDLYQLCSKRHPFFTKLRKKWYIDDEKKFPNNLELTPTRLKHWYVTDGSVRDRSKNTYRVTLHSVNEEHRPEYIEQLFDGIGLECSYDGYGNFRLSHESSRMFFDVIGKEPLPGFSYKWPTEKFK